MILPDTINSILLRLVDLFKSSEDGIIEYNPSWYPDDAITHFSKVRNFDGVYRYKISQSNDDYVVSLMNKPANGLTENPTLIFKIQNKRVVVDDKLYRVTNKATDSVILSLKFYHHLFGFKKFPEDDYKEILDKIIEWANWANSKPKKKNKQIEIVNYILQKFEGTEKYSFNKEDINEMEKLSENDADILALIEELIDPTAVLDMKKKIEKELVTYNDVSLLMFSDYVYYVLACYGIPGVEPLTIGAWLVRNWMGNPKYFPEMFLNPLEILLEVTKLFIFAVPGEILPIDAMSGGFDLRNIKEFNSVKDVMLNLPKIGIAHAQKKLLLMNFIATNEIFLEKYEGKPIFEFSKYLFLEDMDDLLEKFKTRDLRYCYEKFVELFTTDNIEIETLILKNNKYEIETRFLSGDLYLNMFEIEELMDERERNYSVERNFHVFLDIIRYATGGFLIKQNSKFEWRFERKIPAFVVWIIKFALRGMIFERQKDEIFGETTSSITSLIQANAATGDLYRQYSPKQLNKRDLQVAYVDELLAYQQYLDSAKIATEIINKLDDETNFNESQMEVNKRLVKLTELSKSIKEYNEHAIEELEHANMLKERMIELDIKIPESDTEFKELSYCGYVKPDKGNNEKIINANLNGEKCAVRFYRKVLKSCENDPKTYRIILDILKDEIQHIQDLEKLLKWDNYPITSLIGINGGRGRRGGRSRRPTTRRSRRSVRRSVRRRTPTRRRYTRPSRVYSPKFARPRKWYLRSGRFPGRLPSYLPRSIAPYSRRWTRYPRRRRYYYRRWNPLSRIYQWALRNPYMYYYSWNPQQNMWSLDPLLHSYYTPYGTGNFLRRRRRRLFGLINTQLIGMKNKKGPLKKRKIVTPYGKHPTIVQREKDEEEEEERRLTKKKHEQEKSWRETGKYDGSWWGVNPSLETIFKPFIQIWKDRYLEYLTEEELPTKGHGFVKHSPPPTWTKNTTIKILTQEEEEIESTLKDFEIITRRCKEFRMRKGEKIRFHNCKGTLFYLVEKKTKEEEEDEIKYEDPDGKIYLVKSTLKTKLTPSPLVLPGSTIKNVYLNPEGFRYLTDTDTRKMEKGEFEWRKSKSGLKFIK